MSRKAILTLLLMLVMAACASPQASVPEPEGVYTGWPTAGWPSAAPEEQGMNAQLLEQMENEIEKEGINLHSLLVIRHGQIVHETYYPPYKADTRHEMYSVTKSFTGTVVGMLLDQGKLKISERVLDLMTSRTFENVDEQKQAITVEDLLSMRSGLDWAEGDPTFARMYRSRDWVKTVMDLPMADSPGEDFVYCSGCSHVLAALVEEVSGMDMQALARESLFKPLGIQNYRWEEDAQGTALGGWGLQITPRDMAKLGYLYLNNGEWAGKQVVSSSWVDASTARQADAEGRLDYGYQWWIYDQNGAYVAMGRFGQTVWVSPELDLIVVTTAEINDHDPIFALIDRFIVPAVDD